MKWYLTPNNIEFSKWSPQSFSRHIANISFPSVEASDALFGDGWSLLPLTDTPPPVPLGQTVDTRTITVSNDTATANYTLRNKTQKELDAEIVAERAGMKVSMRQARLALNQSGLLSSVETAIASLPEPQKTTVSIEWEYAHVVDRMSPWMGDMAIALGMTEEEMDDLFRLAATL